MSHFFAHQPKFGVFASPLNQATAGLRSLNVLLSRTDGKCIVNDFGEKLNQLNHLNGRSPVMTEPNAKDIIERVRNWSACVCC